MIITVALNGGVTAAHAADAVQDVLEHGRAHCRSISNGEFYAEEGAVTQIDITGDGVSDQPFTFQAQRWKVIHWDEQPVLLLQVPSAACESNNWQPCIKALTWSEGSFHGVVSRP